MIDLLVIFIGFFVSKLCIGDGFPGINSTAQLSTVGYSFLVFNMNIFLQNKKCLLMFLLLVAQFCQNF